MKVKNIITWLFLIGILITVITQNTIKAKKQTKEIVTEVIKKEATHSNTVVLVND